MTKMTIRKLITILQLFIAVATLILAAIQLKENKSNFTLITTLLGGGGIAGLLTAIKAMLPEDKKLVISETDVQQILDAYDKAKMPKNLVPENTGVLKERDIAKEIKDAKYNLIGELLERMRITGVNTEYMNNIEKILDHTNLPIVLVNAMRDLYATKDMMPDTEFTLKYATDFLNMIQSNNKKLIEYNQNIRH